MKRRSRPAYRYSEDGHRIHLAKAPGEDGVMRSLCGVRVPYWFTWNESTPCERCERSFAKSVTPVATQPEETK